MQVYSLKILFLNKKNYVRPGFIYYDKNTVKIVILLQLKKNSFFIFIYFKM